MFKKHGEASGFDSIGDFFQACSLASFLDELDKTDQLPKTILIREASFHIPAMNISGEYYVIWSDPMWKTGNSRAIWNGWGK